METKNSKRRLKESSGALDLFRMHTEVALIDSMLKSKGLTAMVLIGVVFFSCFLYFLFKIAGV
ncbi:hypothetical protein [Alteromonas gracilis]|uniref:hypothetical protein n=1 Tax=Alteromonas gracilis TaxID=1479524 RepID=UPI0030D3E73B